MPMPNCPKCQIPIAKRKFLAITLFRKFRCDMCGVKLKPTKKSVRQNQFLVAILGGLLIGIITATFGQSLSLWIIAIIVFLIALLVQLAFNLASMSRWKFEIRE